MGGVKAIGVCQEGIQADSGAQVNGASAILDLWKKFGVGVEGAPTERDESGAIGICFRFVCL